MDLNLTGKIALVTAASGDNGSDVAEALTDSGVARKTWPRRLPLARVDGRRS
jgi:hypothetical protein